MADNMPVTPGTGRTIATDDVDGVHYQKIKIALGPEDKVGVIKDRLFNTAAASGSNHVVVPAVTGMRIRVVYCALTVAGQVNVKWQSNQATDVTGLFYLDTRSGFVLPFSPHGIFESKVGEALNLNLSAAVTVSGILNYIEIP